MSPLAIEMALHYCIRSGDYGEGCGDNNFKYPAVQELIALFVELGLLIRNPENHAQRYLPTAGLQCFVSALEDIPLPVMRWEIPCG